MKKRASSSLMFKTTSIKNGHKIKSLSLRINREQPGGRKQQLTENRGKKNRTSLGCVFTQVQALLMGVGVTQKTAHYQLDRTVSEKKLEQQGECCRPETGRDERVGGI